MSPTTRLRRSYPDLAAWRRAQGFTTRQAAKTLGVSQTSYCRLEHRMLKATGDRARRIIELTGVPLETLVGLA